MKKLVYILVVVVAYAAVSFTGHIMTRKVDMLGDGWSIEGGGMNSWPPVTRQNWIIRTK